MRASMSLCNHVKFYSVWVSITEACAILFLITTPCSSKRVQTPDRYKYQPVINSQNHEMSLKTTVSVADSFDLDFTKILTRHVG